MQIVNVSSLKNNPSEALRSARDDVVVVMYRDQPDARIALATALFRDGGLSLARSARMAQLPLVAFIAHVSRMGITVVEMDAAETKRDIETLDQWLALS